MLPDLGQPWPTDRDAAISEALVLAIERQVVGELVDQEAGDETDVSAAAFNDPDRCARANDDLRRLDLDHRPPVLEHHVAARTLREPIAVLVANDLEVFRCESCRFRGGQFDDFDRHPRIIEERQAIVAGVGLLRRGSPRVGRDRVLRGRRRRGELILSDRLAQTHLAIGAVDDPAFALLAEYLTLEPVQLMLEGLDFPAERTHQIDDLPRAEGGRLIEAGHTV